MILVDAKDFGEHIEIILNEQTIHTKQALNKTFSSLFLHFLLHSFHF